MCVTLAAPVMPFLRHSMFAHILSIMVPKTCDIWGSPMWLKCGKWQQKLGFSGFYTRRLLGSLPGPSWLHIRLHFGSHSRHYTHFGGFSGQRCPKPDATATHWPPNGAKWPMLEPQSEPQCSQIELLELPKVTPSALKSQSWSPRGLQGSPKCPK